MGCRMDILAMTPTAMRQCRESVIVKSKETSLSDRQARAVDTDDLGTAEESEDIRVAVAAHSAASPEALNGPRAHVEQARAVDLDLAEANPAPDGHRGVDIGSKDVAGKAVRAVVGNRDGLVIGVNWVDRDYWPEHFVNGVGG